MRVKIDDRAREEFLSDDGQKLVVSYTNDGDPFRQGVDFSLFGSGYRSIAHVSLFEHEADRLLECLAKLRGRKFEKDPE